MLRPLLVALALLLCAPATASAATVTVRPEPGHEKYDEVHYVAGPGEANRVLVAYVDFDTITITDPGAVIAATALCVSVDAHTATCKEGEDRSITQTRVELGDGDDEVASTRPGAAPLGSIVASGGPGDDRLDGSAGSDELDGGGGTDTLLGGDGLDLLVDGDPDAAAGPDVLDGGPHVDEVSYAHRTGPVAVTLDDEAGDGAPGEGDVLRGVERVSGGAGDDRLTGGAEPTILDGRGGDDVLVAGSGKRESGYTNALDGGAGDDRLVGGDEADVLQGGGGTDSFTCGHGEDVVREPRRGELLGRACNRVEWSINNSDEDHLSFDPRPRSVRGGIAVFRLACPSLGILDGEPSRCRGPLTLREQSGGRRLLGRGTVADAHEHDDFDVRVALTALGRRLAARPRGVIAAASIRGRGLPARSWTIRLRAG